MGKHRRKGREDRRGWRFVTHEGMSNTIVTLFDAPDGTCYEVTTHWAFDGSTEENQWAGTATAPLRARRPFCRQ